jgi:DNA-binding GntR family transcriptional regulator
MARGDGGTMSEDGSLALTSHPRRQLSDEVANRVREQIMSGQLQPGDFVRQEAVAEELGLSATPVREGLLLLKGEGFLELRPRRGFVVASLSREDVMDLFTAQELLAGELVFRAAGRIGEHDLRELRRVLEDTRKAVASDDRDAISYLCHDFHRKINLAAGAPRLAWMLSISTKFAPRGFFATSARWRRATVRDHAAILRALKDHDGEAARAAMTRHMENAGEFLSAHFEAAGNR